jgi:hypothetical protein
VVLKMLLHLRHGAQLRGLFSSRIEQEELDDTTLRLRVYDAAVFSNYLSLKRTARLDSDQASPSCVLDLERDSTRRSHRD